jgi:4-hydroxy-2-oxovalerate/4-hydroxy-2-oxohexanoate aldolase
VYSSFLLFAQRAAARYGVPARDILVELGQMGAVGGQEDMIEDVAINLAAKLKVMSESLNDESYELSGIYM